MKTYYPRMAATLFVPVDKDPSKSADPPRTWGGQEDPPAEGAISFAVRVRKAKLESNSHNHADSLHLTIEWFDAGIDPRSLRNATVEFYMANAESDGTWTPSRDNLRFVGVCVRVERGARAAEGFHVEMEFLDYTSFFLKQKPFSARGLPPFSARLDQAWRQICDHVGWSSNDNPDVIHSSVKILRDHLVLEGKNLTAFPKLGTAAAPRFERLSRVTPPAGADAWAVWQQCCGMLGLISFILKDQCIVTTATDYYNGTGEKPPRFIWTKNILGWKEARKASVVGEGVGLTSFNPITGTTLEALYPDPHDPRLQHKHIAAKKAGDEASWRAASKYVYFAVPEITSQAALNAKAQSVFEERARQDLEGTIVTSELFVERDNAQGETFDLLTLAAGDNITVEFDEDMRTEMAHLPTDHARIEVLTRRGYNEGAAKVVVANLANVPFWSPQMLVKKVDITLESTNEGGSFEVEINYCSKFIPTA